MNKETRSLIRASAGLMFFGAAEFRAEEVALFRQSNNLDQVGRWLPLKKKAAWHLVFSLLGLFLASPLVAQDLHLRVLAATGTAEEVKRALQNGADFNDHDWTGVTALMAAAGNNRDARVVPVLLQSGAFVDAADMNGETALMYAAECNSDPAVIAALLTKGAGIETRDKLGRTALIYAAKSGAPLDVLTAFLKAGASVNARDCYGMTPLLYSVRVGQNPALCLELLSAGADPKVQNLAGRTLIECAEDNPIFERDKSILQKLREAMKGAYLKVDKVKG